MTCATGRLCIKVFNCSTVAGGQEQYLIRLLHYLYSQSLLSTVGFVGGPESVADDLGRLGKVQVQAPSPVEAVELLNGNRALYEYGWRLPSKAVRIYVQHSSTQDVQAGRWRRAVRQVLLKLLLRRMDAVIRVSAACLPDDFAPGKIRTVPNGVDPRQFPLRSSWRQPGDVAPWRLLMVGALTPNKNQALAIELLARWPDAELTLVGEGEQGPALQAKAREAGVADRVRWAGQQPDTARYYQEADVCLLLSHHEAAPFVLLEAMACGTPVLAARVGGVPEVLVDGETGALLRERTVDALVAVLDQWRAQPEVLERMGRRAHARVCAQFTVAHMAQGFMDVVAQAQASRGAR